MLLNQIVEVSEQLKATRSRTAKIEAMARLLRERSAHELRTIVAWMSGDLLQGRIGISKGRAHQFGQGVGPSDVPSLTIEDVDRALVTVQGASGPGSQGGPGSRCCTRSSRRPPRRSSGSSSPSWRGSCGRAPWAA